MKNYKKVAIAAAVPMIMLAVVAGIYVESSRAAVTIDPQSLYPVADVVDGDTFKAMIGANKITVRVLGINTPETVDPRKGVQCYGPEASKKGHELLDGQKVRLELNPHREITDKYGRYLAYVHLADGLDYNKFMIENGFAREYTVGKPYDKQQEFRAAEKKSKTAGLGLWGMCGKR